MSNDDFSPNYSPLSDAIDISRATYFALEAYREIDGDIALCSIEKAEIEGGFALYVGLPDYPAGLEVDHFMTIQDGVSRLADLEVSNPGVSMWLSAKGRRAQIDGGNVWEGVVYAQAEIDLDAEDSAWVQLSRIITRVDNDGVSLDWSLREWAQGQDELPSVICDIFENL